MSNPSQKTIPAGTDPSGAGPNIDEAVRLEQIRKLWSQLARLRTNSAEHRDLVRQIRQEADAFRRLTEKK